MTNTSQTLLQYKPRTFPSSFWAMVKGVLVAEICVRWRDPGTAVLIVVLAALTQVLSPGPDAFYTTISVHGAKPIMSVDTNLVAVAVILATILLPIYLMMLGLGMRRDVIRGLNYFHGVMPISGAFLNLGRVLAGGFAVFGYTIIFLLLLMLSDLMNHGRVPSIIALTAFVLISLTAGFAALGISVVIDRFIFSPGKRILAAFIAWMALIMMSIFGNQDILGYNLLRANLAPDSTFAPISIGISPAEGLQKIDWFTLLIPTDWLTDQLLLLLMVGACAVLLAMIFGTAHSKTTLASPATQSEIKTPEIAKYGPALQIKIEGTTGILMAARLVCGRWLKGRRYTLTLLVAGSILAVAGANLYITVAVILLFPVFLLSRSRPSLDNNSFNMSFAALWRPTPSLFTVLVFGVILLIPLSPALIMLPIQQAVHLSLSCLCAVAWLVLTCIIWGRTQLGVSIYIILWYGLVANQPPHALDIFGIHSSQFGFFIAMLMAAIILLMAIAFADQTPKKRK